MLKTGLHNAQINSLLCRMRHTNEIVIANRSFPFWPMIETVDISLVDDIPTVLQVLNAITPDCSFDQIFMAKEFLAANTEKTKQEFSAAFGQIPVNYEPDIDFQKRIPNTIGLIRTGDTIQYANVILVST